MFLLAFWFSHVPPIKLYIQCSRISLVNNSELFYIYPATSFLRRTECKVPFITIMIPTLVPRFWTYFISHFPDKIPDQSTFRRQGHILCRLWSEYSPSYCDSMAVTVAPALVAGCWDSSLHCASGNQAENDDALLSLPFPFVLSAHSGSPAHWLVLPTFPRCIPWELSL